MKFVQLIEYNIRKIFFERSYTKCDGETSPRPISEKSELNLSVDQYYKVLHSLFSLYVKLMTIKIY